jgi:O-antigen/teichoic acid export membrane protein
MTTGVLALIPVAIIVTLVFQTTGLLDDVVWPITLAFGIAAGIATLASTWLNNALIADGHLGRSNLVNLAAVMSSLLAAYLSLDYGLSAALSSLLLQPLIVASAAMLLDPNLRPKSLGVHRATMVLLFHLGLMPFLSGLSVLLMHQVERWSIASILGSEALGEFYIVLMYTTFFGLIPTALLNVYFPQAKRAYVARDPQLLMDFVGRHQRDLLAYFLVAVLVTMILMPTAVARFLPDFTDSTALVYYALPGLMLFTQRNIASMVLFSSGEMGPLLVSGVMTLSLFSVGLAVLWAVGHFNLVSVLIARGLATLPGTMLLVMAQRRQINNMDPE